ncbi:MAG: ribbon-helix-helix domain-containing protein [Pseudobdellovibrionaceae bacterium]
MSADIYHTPPAKHSVTLHGHRTSLTLEPAFWDALQLHAQKTGVSLNALIADIDEKKGANTLTSAVRLYLFSLAKAGQL